MNGDDWDAFVLEQTGQIPKKVIVGVDRDGWMNACQHTRHEKINAKKATENRKLPTPTGDLWDAIKNHYNLPDPRKVDGVLSFVTLPLNWEVKIDVADQTGRTSEILDHKGVRVGNTSLKRNYMQYKGTTTFYYKRVLELGIIEEK